MRKITLSSTILLLTIVSAFAQTTLVDFEEIPYNQGAWNGISEVITNTITDGINASANACKYTTAADAAWGNCAWVITENEIEYQYLDSIQLMVLAPSATQMYVKLENDNLEDEATGEAYAEPTQSSEWQKVTLVFGGISGEDSLNTAYNKFAFFFNVNDGVGGEDWYYDNVVAFYKDGSSIPVAIAGDDQTVAQGDLVTLGGGASYDADGDDLTFNWESLSTEISLDDFTAVSPTFTAPEVDGSTDFKFVLTVNDGMFDSKPDTVTVTVQDVVSVNNNIESTVSMYPNPAFDFISVKGEAVSVTVYDMTGKLIMKELIYSEVQKINVGDLERGVYIVSILNNKNESQTFKINKL